MSGGSNIDVTAVKARTDLADVVGRLSGVAWDRKKSNPRKGDYWACCPFHSEKTPSFHVTRTFYKCFGCGAAGDVFKFLAEFSGLDFKDALAYLAGELGIASDGGNTVRDSSAGSGPPPNEGKNGDTARQPDDSDRRAREHDFAKILGIWRGAELAEGSPVETYLRRRGITCPIPATLRHAPDLMHWPTRTRHPAMVAVIQAGDGRAIGVHRTYLAADGAGKADVKPVKMVAGAMKGGAIRLCPVARHVRFAEGIETSLAVLQATGKASWAAISLHNFGVLDLPAEIREVTICADNDMADWREGRRTVKKAANALALMGRTVRQAWPPRGKDWNDVLQAGRHER